MKIRSWNWAVCAVMTAALSIALTGCAQRRAGVAAPQAPTTAVAPEFREQARVFADVTKTLNGTWTLKQRLNPDGTPYKSRLEGVTYINVTNKGGDNLGPHAVATLYAKESGVADPNFFPYPKDIVGKPFTMESTGTWLIHNVTATEAGAEVSARVFTMAKGTLQPFPNGLVMNADIRYKLSRESPRAGAAATPRMAVSRVNMGPLTDLNGRSIDPSTLLDACCGMTSLTLGEDRMEIGWNNKGKDIWVKSSPTVPAQFR